MKNDSGSTAKPLSLLTLPRKLAHCLLLALAVTVQTAFAEDLKIWSGYPELTPFYERVAEGIKSEYPDVSITVETIPLREHEKRVALGLSSGSSGAVVVELSRSTATRYLENELLSKAPDDIVEFVNNAENFGEFFRDAATHAGTVYGVPLFRGQGALFYNTDMFAEAGLSGPPQTMEEFTDYASKLTKRDGDGNPEVSGWSLRLSGGGQGIAEKFWINMFQYGGNLIEESDGKWRSNVAGEPGQKALAQYLDNVHTLKNVTVEMPADAEAFERQQTAMFIRESWVIGDIAAKSPDLNYATSPLPTGTIGLPANLYVNAEGDAADAAWAFVKASNEPEHLVWLLENVGWLPNRSNVDYSPVLDKTPAFGGFLDYPEDYQFFTLPAIGPIEEILTRVAESLTGAFADADLAGDADAQAKMLEDVQSDINKILEREGLLAE